MSCRTQNGSAPLHTVVSHRGKPELAALLLMRGAYVDDQAVDGTTALHIACQKGSIDMVRACAALGLEVGARNCGSSLVREGPWEASSHLCPGSCWVGSHEKLTSVSDSRRMVSAMTSWRCSCRVPCVCRVALHGLGQVRLLLEYKADVSLLNCNGLSTLIYASHYGHAKIVQLLVDHNAPDVSDTSGAKVRLRKSSICGMGFKSWAEAGRVGLVAGGGGAGEEEGGGLT